MRLWRKLHKVFLIGTSKSGEEVLIKVLEQIHNLDVIEFRREAKTESDREDYCEFPRRTSVKVDLRFVHLIANYFSVVLHDLPIDAYEANTEHFFVLSLIKYWLENYNFCLMVIYLLRDKFV